MHGFRHIFFFGIALLFLNIIPNVCGKDVNDEIFKDSTFPYSNYEDQDGIIDIHSIELYNDILNSTSHVTNHFTLLYLTSLDCEECDIFENRVLRKISSYIDTHYNHFGEEGEENEESDGEIPDRHKVVFTKMVKELMPEVFATDLLNRTLNLPRILVFPPSSSKFIVEDEKREGEEKEESDVSRTEKKLDELFFSYLKSYAYEYEIEMGFQNDLNAENYKFADFLAKTANVFIQIKEDFEVNNFLRHFVILLIVFVYFKKQVLPLIKNRIWYSISFVFSLVLILLSCTGFSFVRMNHIGLLAKNDKGEMMWFSGGMWWQFGIEIFSVSGMYILMGGLVLGLIYLGKNQSETDASVNSKEKGQEQEEKEQSFSLSKDILVVILLLFLVLSTRYFTSCFKIKNPSYMT